MAKEKKQDGGWQFPKALEIVKCKEGNKEFMKERPARTDTTYFHDYIYGKAEIRFVRGRLRFTDDEGNTGDPAPFPSMVVIYNGERVKNE